MLKLGLQKLLRNGLIYEDFKEMNRLWVGYMKELLPNLDDPNLLTKNCM
jgi:hypothetical protein